MGKVSLKENINKINERTITFITFLDSLLIGPGDLPQYDFQALTESFTFLKKYLELLDKNRSIGAKKLIDIDNHVRKLDVIAHAAQDSLLMHVIDNLIEIDNEQFQDYHAYADAEKAWHYYSEFIKKHNLDKFRLEKMQALINRTTNPRLLVTIFINYLKQKSNLDFDIFQVGLACIKNLIEHTPRSEYNSKTLYQVKRKKQKLEFEKWRKEKDRIGFSDYDFDDLFNKLGSKDTESRKTGIRMLNQLWDNYIAELHNRIRTEDMEHHKNIAALWNQVIQRFFRASTTSEKMLALKPTVKLRCSFVPYAFYTELKELIIKGIDDESGTVRYRTVRLLEDMAYELLENTPNDYDDLYNLIHVKRDEYIKRHKLRRQGRVYPSKIKDMKLRSLTQALNTLDYFKSRRNSYNSIFMI